MAAKQPPKNVKVLAILRLRSVRCYNLVYLTHEDCTEPTAGINEEPFIQAARDSFGKKGAEEMADLLLKNEQMLAGGTLREDQKDMFFAAISKVYFINKEHACQKFGP